MGRIADGRGVEQPDGSFLHQRTHTPDPFLPLSPRRRYGGFQRYKGH